MPDHHLLFSCQGPPQFWLSYVVVLRCQKTSMIHSPSQHNSIYWILQRFGLMDNGIVCWSKLLQMIVKDKVRKTFIWSGQWITAQFIFVVYHNTIKSFFSLKKMKKSCHNFHISDLTNQVCTLGITLSNFFSALSWTFQEWIAYMPLWKTNQKGPCIWKFHRQIPLLSLCHISHYWHTVGSANWC